MDADRKDRALAAACLSSMDCVGYLEGRGDATAAGAVQRHLDACERCRVLVAETARATFGDGFPSGSVAVRALADGEKLGGRYEIRRFIARGGMGEVYEAADLALGETVALKTLSPTTLDQSDAASRLIAEVRLARKVVHTNVCRILEFGLHRRQGGDTVEVIPFLTMELLEGETLASRVRREGPLSPERALRVLKELAGGLAAVHEAGIVHRDFKTENVFLVKRKTGGAPSGDESAVVMDFGLARALEINRGTGASSARGLIGTVAYMAPEQVEGHRPTPAFDVYALGIVAFEMITGRLPFVGDSPLAVATIRLRQEAPRPSSLRRELACGWDHVIGRCLARDPNRRYRGVDDVVAGLERYEMLGPSGNILTRQARAIVLTIAGAAAIAVSVGAVKGLFREGPVQSVDFEAGAGPLRVDDGAASVGRPPAFAAGTTVEAPASPEAASAVAGTAATDAGASAPGRSRAGERARPTRKLRIARRPLTATSADTPQSASTSVTIEDEDDLVNPFVRHDADVGKPRSGSAQPTTSE